MGDAPPGGLIERFFGTAQTQFEAEVRAGPLLALSQLNQAFTAWLEVDYHQRPNSETGQSPRVRYEQGRAFTRHVDLQRVLRYFLQRARRKVDPIYSDVRLEGWYFRVDPQSRGDWLEVHYDPFTELQTVLLYSAEGEYLGVGQRHQREGPVEQPASRPPGQAQYSYLDLLIQKHEQSLQQRSSGIDYPAALARSRCRWPFLDFAKQLATRLGRSGGLSALRSDELETLQKIHARLPYLDADLLE